MEEHIEKNPLGSAPIPRLMINFAIPSIIAMLIGALYNIVDQLFIGQAVGTLGNAATNVAFPLTTSSTALALLFGVGGASCFNLDMGRGNQEKAIRYIGNAAAMLVITGVILCVFTEIFLTPLLKGFGSPDDVLPYAQSYVRITAIGFPFLILTTGGGHLIRADGSPRMTMACSLTGAIINIFLDAWFVMVLGLGMAGAAFATIIGQIVSGIMVIVYLAHYKTVSLKWQHLKLNGAFLKGIITVGMSSCFNQIAMMIVQIVMNNSLTYYGGLSEYGEAIPLACVGIAVKVSQIFFASVIGLAQGAQPIESFNYGAKQFWRVRGAYKFAVTLGVAISVGSFLVFQIFPRQILLLFGNNTEQYFEFGVKFFRIFFFMIWLNALQPITANLFSAIGKAQKGVFLSLTRQIIFLLPLIVILPRFFGIMGLLYASPIADSAAGVTAITMARREFRLMKREEEEISAARGDGTGEQKSDTLRGTRA